MIAITISKRSKHNIYGINHSQKSLASMILLKNYYKSLEPDERLDQVKFNEKFLEIKLEEYGQLDCVYCEKKDLKIIPWYISKKRSDYNIIATVDHVVPISKGGNPKDYKNMVTCCHKCNQKKGDKIGYKNENNKYTF